jgi:hypothetical protein
MYEINLGKKIFEKKVRSPLSMNFGRISTSKCRGYASKNGVLYTQPPQEVQALATCKGLKKLLKKGIQKKLKKNLCTQLS